LGPYKIVDLNENNAKFDIKPNKFKVVNIARLKDFCEDKNKSFCQEDTRFSESDSSLFQDTNTNCPQRPMTRALKKLLDYKNAATMAISILHQDCNFLQDPYTFTKNYTQYCCDKCYGTFKTMKFKVHQKPQKIDSLLQETNNNVYSKADLQNVELLLKQKINNAQSTAEMPNSITFTSALCQLIKNYKYCNCDAEKDADPPVIGAIKEALRGQLTSIASKLKAVEH